MFHFVQIFLIGVGLSMDAFAVAVCKGLSMRRVDKKQCLTIALFFGGFQAGMPLLGWLLGTRLARYVSAADHWIAFILLVYIGGKMLWDAWGGTEDDAVPATPEQPVLDLKELTMMAVATSIDALAVGVTFAFDSTPILPAVAIIGCTTFSLSVAGVFVGNRFGSRYERRAAIAGGLILVLIGVKILLEGLFPG